MSSLRGSAMRLWRRVQAVRRRRKAVTDGIIALILLALLCVASPRAPCQSHTEEIDTQVDVPGGLGQYVILYTTTTATSSGGHLTSTKYSHNLTGTPRERRPVGGGGKMNAESQIKAKSRRQDITKQRHQQKQSWTQIDPNSSPPDKVLQEEDSTNFRSSNNNDDEESEVPWQGNQKGGRREMEEEEEEDPDLGRGFQEELVTYHSDGNSVTWLEVEAGERREETNEGETSSGEKYSAGYSSGREENNLMESLKKEKYSSGYSLGREERNFGETSKNVKYSVGYPFSRERTKENEEYYSFKTDTIGERTKDDKGYRSINTHRTENSVNEVYGQYSKERRRKSENRVENYKYKDYDVNNPKGCMLVDDTREYFIEVGDRVCFHDGTDVERTKASSSPSCHCLEEYFGADCGIPAAAWFSMYMNKYPKTRLTPRQTPRRIINGLPVNHEFAMFEARMHELFDVVDVFIVAESNYTAHGDAKIFNFLNRFRQGYLAQFQDKIVYVSLGYFPKMSRENGWMADAYLRFHLGDRGLRLVKGLRDDDLFVLSDADELPTREILTFLKVYDGYPEPVSFALRWNVFGFFWMEPPEDTWLNLLKGAREAVSVVSSAATIAMLRDVLFNNAFYIRKTGLWQYYKLVTKLRQFRNKGHLVKEWTAGTAGHYAGWHCSWCFSPENIVLKMDSAQANDVPRWGNFPEKRNLSYIASRIRHGIWFDDTKRFMAVRRQEDPYYAPRYLLDHPHLYRSILFHPDHPFNLNRPWMPP